MTHLKRLLVTMLVVAMVLSTAGLAAAATPPDVIGEPCEEAVAYLMDLGIIAGYPDGTFQPARTLNRAEMVKIIVLATLGEQGEQMATLLKGAYSFPDVPADHWASGYIMIAKNLGIVEGYPDGTFKPLNNVSHIELVKMLVVAAGIEPAEADWPMNYAGPGIDAGVVLEDVGVNDPLTRCEMARMVAYTIHEVPNPVTGKTLGQSVFGESAVATIEISPAEASLAAGAEQQFTAVAYDADGDEVEGETFAWAVVGSGAINALGKYVAGVPGTATISATIGDVTGTASVTVFGAATAIHLAPETTLVANNKSETALAAHVVDALGNVVTNYTGTVTFASTVPGVATIKIASVAAVDGVATTTLVAGPTAGTTTLSASASGGLAGTLSYTTIAQVLTSVTVVADPVGIAADNVSFSAITLTLKDQVGETLQAARVPTVTVRLTNASPAIAGFDYPAKTATKDMAFVAAGAATGTVNLYAKNAIGVAEITGVVTTAAYADVPVNPVSVTVQLVGPSHHLVISPIASKTAGTALSITVRVLDINGNQVTQATDTISLYRGTDLVGSMAATYGKAVFSDTQTVAKDYTYTAKASGLVDAPGVVATVTPAAAAALDLSASPSTLAATGTAISTLTAKVTDAYGNTVSTGTYAVTFEKTINNDATAAFTKTVVNTVEGQAAVTVTSTTNHDKTDTFRATATGLTADTAMVTTKVMGTANKLAWGTIAPPKVAGTNMSVKVHVQDALGTDLTLDQGRDIMLKVWDGTTVVAELTASTVNGVATFTVNQTKAATYTLEATSTGLTGLTVANGWPGSAVFTAGAAASIKLTPEFTTMSAIPGATNIIKVELADQFGNAVTSGTTTLEDATVTSSTTSVGTVAPATLGANYTQNVTFTATATPGTSTVTVAKTGLSSGAVTITTVLTGAPANIIVAAAPTKMVGEWQALSFIVVDAAGNQVTTYTGCGYLTIEAQPDGSTIWLERWNGTAWVTYTAGDHNGAYKGEWKYRATSNGAGTVTYKINPCSDPALGAKTVSGVFTPDEGEGIVIYDATPQYIVANGVSVATITAKVLDNFGNVDTAATGTMKFEIVTGNDFAVLLATEVAVVNGVASTTAQSKDREAGAGWVYVRATWGLEVASGNVLYVYAGTDLALAATPAPPAAQVGMAWSYDFDADNRSGGLAPFTYTIFTYNGLTMSADGVLSGTPITDVVAWGFTVTVEDQTGATASRIYTIQIRPAVSINTTDPLAGRKGIAYSHNFPATGGLSPYTWNHVSGTLPAGLTLNPATGILSGEPTTADTYTYTIRVTDTATQTSEHEFTHVIDPQVAIVGTALPDARVDETYTYTFAAADGVEPYVWAIIAGQLPDGLTLNTATGELAGTPEAGEDGTWNFTVQVTDELGQSDTWATSLDVLEAFTGNANLASLTENLVAALDPVFHEDTTEYTLDAIYAEDEVTIAAVADDAANATVTINGNASPQTIDLDVGANTITVVVTADDGVTQKTYTIVVPRAVGSSVSSLANLTLTEPATPLAPGFDSATLAYGANVANVTELISITATLTDASATMTLNESPMPDDTAVPVALAVGVNVFTIRVEAENFEDTGAYTEYTITIVRDAS